MCVSRELFIVAAQLFRDCATSLRAVAASVVGVGEGELLGVGVCNGVAVGVATTTVVLLFLLIEFALLVEVLVEMLPLRGGSAPPFALFLSFRISHAPTPP